MRTVETLIDECIKVCGGQAELARRIGGSLGRQDVQHLASGKRKASPAMVGLLCDVLELPAEESRRLAALAIINTAKADKQGVLRRAFFVSWMGGLALFGAFTPQTSQATMQLNHGNLDNIRGLVLHSIYIVLYWLNNQYRLFMARKHGLSLANA